MAVTADPAVKFGSNRRIVPITPVYYRCMAGPARDVTAFILAGGKSSRMGTDKAFVTFQGRTLQGCTLLDRALEVARSTAADVRIVGDAAKFSGFAPVVEDIFRDCGPLGGIHAALRASATDLNVMLAVDVPFVSPALLEYLIERARGSPAPVTAVHASGGWQPLCAVYRREFADAAEQALRKGQYKIDALFVGRVQKIEESELKVEGFSIELFRNLNTPEELENARKG